MLALNRNEKIICEKCGDNYRRSDAARHRKRCDYKDDHKCPNCNFMSQEEGTDGLSCCEEACSTKLLLSQ